MGIVMIRCPKTRRAISTGIRADRATFHSTQYSSVARFVHCVGRRTNGSPRMRGSAIPGLRIATRAVSAKSPSRHQGNDNAKASEHKLLFGKCA
jgi:hypothetical protein